MACAGALTSPCTPVTSSFALRPAGQLAGSGSLLHPEPESGPGSGGLAILWELGGRRWPSGSLRLLHLAPPSVLRGQTTDCLCAHRLAGMLALQRKWACIPLGVMEGEVIQDPPVSYQSHGALVSNENVGFLRPSSLFWAAPTGSCWQPSPKLPQCSQRPTSCMVPQ